MADLNGNTIASTYTGLLKTSDNGARGAAGLLAKVGLGAVPGAQALSAVLLATDVMAIYGILSDLAE